MLKLTKTGIGLLTKQYRSVLRKCLLLNLELFSAIIIGTIPNAKAGFTIYYNRNVSSPTDQDYAKKSIYAYDVSDINASISLATARELNDALNYYYTFRVDESNEVIEFAKELRSNKKEMSSLDFMPIKSSSDLRISLIKAEDPLTFSAKTRDDSLVLMEVCHA